MKPLLPIVLIVLTALAGMAQQGRVGRGQPPPNQGSALLHITPTPSQIFSSLKDLAAASLLIVEGTVKATLPSRETSPRALETDAVIAVRRVLKGPADVREVVISQRGGSRGGLVVMPAQYSLVQPGEHYVLFLTEDSRPDIPDVPGVRRYLVTGLWTGLFRFQEGKMHTDARKVDPLRAKYEGVSAEEIIEEVKASLW
ncbi:MAG TPA: hypothetical protein VFQ79_18120 [Bryobacteraceae bacterium]|nr:hypothetical protein [Bryobacteraceae bacterium]